MRLLSRCCTLWLVGALCAAAAHADATTGQLIFNQCAACHAIDPDAPPRIGPHLWGVVGRPVAAVADYDYSDALQALGGVWNEQTLNRFLYAPAEHVPGTNMVFPGIRDDTQRAHVIDYLRTLGATASAAPAPSSTAFAADDPFGADWPAGPGREVTGYTCNACHSLAIVKQQGLSRETWDELLDWMVEEQGMAEPPADQRALMLDYLAAHFGIER